MWLGADEEAEVAAREKDGGVRSDSALDLYMKAAALEGKRESVVTDYMLRILGMDVSPLASPLRTRFFALISEYLSTTAGQVSTAPAQGRVTEAACMKLRGIAVQNDHACNAQCRLNAGCQSGVGNQVLWNPRSHCDCTPCPQMRRVGQHIFRTPVFHGRCMNRHMPEDSPQPAHHYLISWMAGETIRGSGRLWALLQARTLMQVCADTPIGNEMIRGISGGQKKRVTLGEKLVGPKQARSPCCWPRGQLASNLAPFEAVQEMWSLSITASHGRGSQSPCLQGLTPGLHGAPTYSV